MKYIKQSNGYTLVVETRHDLIYLKQILRADTRIRFLDYRRPTLEMPRAKVHRQEKELSTIEMHVLNTLIKDEMLIVHGAIQGSSFHNYYIHANKSVFIYGRPNTVAQALIKLAKLIKPIYVLIMDYEEYSYIALTDYTYNIKFYDTFKTTNIKENVGVIATRLLAEGIPEIIMVSDFILSDTLAKHVARTQLRIIPYALNIPALAVLDKTNFYKSNAFSALSAYTIMHKEKNLYHSLKGNTVTAIDIQTYAEAAALSCIYVGVSYIEVIYTLLATHPFTIVSDAFAETYNLPPVFATVRYTLYGTNTFIV